MIENLDLISDYGDDLSLAMEQEAAWKSREVDLLTNKPRLKKEIDEPYKDPDINSVGSEAAMIKRYDEDSDNEVILKPAKSKNFSKPKKQKEAKKTAKKKSGKTRCEETVRE